MTILNRNQIIALGQSTTDLFDFMEADKVYVETSHIHFTGEPRVTLNPKGNTISVISEEHGEVEIFSPAYNNFLPHNLIAIHY
jgi:uncharacterized protein (DUF2345 family)